MQSTSVWYPCYRYASSGDCIRSLRFWTISLYFGDFRSLFSCWLIDFCSLRCCFRRSKCSSFYLFFSIISLIFLVIKSFFALTFSGDNERADRPLLFSYCFSCMARDPPDVGVMGRSLMNAWLSELNSRVFLLDCFIYYCSSRFAFVKKKPELTRSRFKMLLSTGCYSISNFFRSSSCSIILTMVLLRSSSCNFCSCRSYMLRYFWIFFW